MKILLFIFLWAPAAGNPSGGDTVDIYTCLRSAKNTRPLAGQADYIRMRSDLTSRNLSVNYLPEISLNGKASYQSEVFKIPGTAAFPDYPVIPKDQYQATINLRQNLFDGGITRSMKQMEEARAESHLEYLETELYGTYEIVNQLYFSSLFIQENIQILLKSHETLGNQKMVIESRVINGVLLPSSLYNIEKELARLEQDITALKFDHQAALQMLGKWTGLEIADISLLSVPETVGTVDTALSRPELSYMKSQRELLEANKSLIQNRALPVVSIFAQGGYGSPNPLNFFETDFNTFYLAGVQLNWKPFDWGKIKREVRIQNIQQNEISLKEDDLAKIIRNNLTRDFSDIRKYENLLDSDNRIIDWQQKVVDQYYSQLQNGVITSAEYLAEFNTLTILLINRRLHELNLAQSKLNILIKTGKIDTI